VHGGVASKKEALTRQSLKSLTASTKRQLRDGFGATYCDVSIASGPEQRFWTLPKIFCF
jgi:hypothetical protein